MRKNPSRILFWGALLFTGLFFAVFLICPLYTVIREGLDPVVFAEVLRNPLYLRGLLNAFAISAVTTVLVFSLALPLALLYDKYEFPGKSACSILMMLPMILPPFVGALGFQQLLGHYGVFNSILTSVGLPRIDWLGGSGRFWSICAIEALHLYPILYLNLITALGNIDPSLRESAKTLGLSKQAIFRKITLPLMRPGILAGGSIVMIWSFTELGTPLMFGFNTVLPVQVFNGITELGTNPSAYVLVIIMLAVASVLYLSARLCLGGGMNTTDTAAQKGSSSHAATVLNSWKRFLPGSVFGLVTFLAVLPHLALILNAGSVTWYNTILPLRYTLRNFESALSEPLVVPSIVNSIRYSLLATVLAVLVGLFTAILTKRVSFRGAFVFDLFGMLPLMVPGIVLAVGFLGMSIQYPWARGLFDPIKNPVFLLGAAYAIRRVPYVLRAAASGLEQTPRELERAARNMGAGIFRTFRAITLPLIAANLIVGALFAFSFSMLEVSDSLILAQKAEFFPITKAIYELSQYLGEGSAIASAFGVWAMLFLAATLLCAGVLTGKKFGSLFKF